MKTAHPFVLSPVLLMICACGPREQPTTVSGPIATAPSATPPEQAPAAEPDRWRCGELLLSSTYAKERAELSFSGRTLALAPARSASGARYADGHGNEFWTKGGEGTLVLAGEEKRDCTTTQDVSPWEAAKTRGVQFRGIGQEPGWWVEIGPGDSPPLHAELDYGERKIDVAKTLGISSTRGYGGQLDDGTSIVLRTWQEPCSDAMSGERFEQRAELTVGDKAYRGCGVYLGD